MRTIRASEIGSYLYCHRAWWYQYQGIQADNLDELAAGKELHQRHGQAVFISGCLQILAYLLLFATLILLTTYAVNRFL
jgi:hypothetical protein